MTMKEKLEASIKSAKLSKLSGSQKETGPSFVPLETQDQLGFSISSTLS